MSKSLRLEVGAIREKDQPVKWRLAVMVLAAVFAGVLMFAVYERTAKLQEARAELAKAQSNVRALSEAVDKASGHIETMNARDEADRLPLAR